MSARLKILAAIACVVAAGWLGLASLGRDAAAGPGVPREPFSRVWTERPVTLVGIGDSVTRGFGSSRGRSYFELLLRTPADDAPDMRGIHLRAVFPSLQAINLSVNSSTSFQHLDQIERIPPGGTNTLGWVVMTTGGNDLIHNYGRTPPREDALYGATLAQSRAWIAGFDRRLNRMLNRIRDRFPGGCYVFLANIYDPTDGKGDIEKAGLPPWPEGERLLAAYNDVIARAGRRPGVHVVDMRGAFMGHGIHHADRGLDYWYHINLEDPNDRGYDAIRRIFLRAMAAVAAAKIP